MPKKLTDELLKRMIREGYIVLAIDQTCLFKEQDELLYDFGRVPPESDAEAREVFFDLYREAQNYTLVDGKVYRKKHSRPPHRRRRRR